MKPNLLSSKYMKRIKEKYLLFRARSFKDTDAYGQIYDIYVERIYRFIYFKVRTRLEAEDLTSEAFLKAWQYIKEGKQIKNLNAFIYTVARNLVVDHYRAQAKKYNYEEVIADDFSSNINIAEKMEVKSDAEEVLRAIKTLKDEYSEVIILRFLDDLSISEIADIINKTSNNTRVLVHRALSALKKSLKVDQK